MTNKSTRCDSWHKAAADAKYDTYFGKMTVSSVPIERRRIGNHFHKHLPNLILIKGRLGILQHWNVIFFDKQRNVGL
jgi:hypothetical protein